MSKKTEENQAVKLGSYEILTNEDTTLEGVKYILKGKKTTFHLLEDAKDTSKLVVKNVTTPNRKNHAIRLSGKVVTVLNEDDITSITNK